MKKILSIWRVVLIIISITAFLTPTIILIIEDHRNVEMQTIFYMYLISLVSLIFERVIHKVGINND